MRDNLGRSLETCNHYIRSMKSFCNWLVTVDCLARNPLNSVAIYNSKTDRRHDRRALDMDEFLLMLEAAKTGPPVEGIVGPDRAMLYILAAWTGFRKGELGSLTLNSFNLTLGNPTVSVQAGYSNWHSPNTCYFFKE